MKKFKILAFLFFLTAALPVEAAVLFSIPPSREVGVGENITLDIKIDGEGTSFNAAQSVIRFPRDTLEVISLDKTGSAFSFWLEEPNFSNADGVISFTGGTPYGVSGSSVQVLKIIFKSKGSGSGAITFHDSAVTASDGSGTNILSKTTDSSFSVLVQKAVSPVSAPKQIVREAVSIGRLPQKPVLRVPLYTDEKIWSSILSNFTAQWDLPSDVTGVGTALNKQSVFSVPASSEGLFDNKTFEAPSDGIWYLHVSFKNDIGWGPTANYKIAIDTAPPAGFDLSVDEGESTNNPSPTLRFKTGDALSGIKEYRIKIDDQDAIQIMPSEFDGSFKLPLQPPGAKHVFVKAIDYAGNSTENGVNLEIIPITSPVITFVTKDIFSEEEKEVVVKGTAPKEFEALLSLWRGKTKVADRIARPDEKNSWEVLFDEPLRNGDYKITVQNRDLRGALSLVVESPSIKVRGKPIIQIGPLKLGKGGTALLLLFILIAGFAGGVWFYKKRQEKLAMRVSFAESEITKIFQLMKDDTKQLFDALKTSTIADDEYAVNRLRENIQKMEAYLKRGVEKIKK